jgi:hypothetical protein
MKLPSFFCFLKYFSSLDFSMYFSSSSAVVKYTPPTLSTQLDKACEDLTAVLVKIGVMEAVDTSDNIFTKISPFLFSIFGPNGFSEMPGIIIDTIIKPLFSSASSILSR